MLSESLITLTDPTSAAAEAYRTLRINLEFASVDKPIKTLLVASTSPDDDKETVLGNLAVVLADGGQQIILVDADLRRPRLHTLFGLSNTQGFSDMFRDDALLETPPLQTIPNTTLSVLPSGTLPQIPSQILNSAKMKQVLETLKTMADLVLFNAPPLITVTDGALLASRVDGTLLTVKANVSKREHVQEAKSRLAKVNATLLGAVLSNAPLDATLKDYYER